MLWFSHLYYPPLNFEIFLDRVHVNVYNKDNMKKAALEKWLRKHGWRFLRHGGKHDIWTNGEDQQAIPRHKEINEYTAKSVMRRAMAEEE